MAAVATNGHARAHDAKDSKQALPLPTPPASGAWSPKSSPALKPMNTAGAGASITALAADTEPPQWYPDAPWKLRALVLWWCAALAFQFGVFVPWLIADNPNGPTRKERDADGISQDDSPMFGWYFMYLTMIGGYQQIAYFVHALIDIAVATGRCRVATDRAAKIHTARDKFFALSFSVTSFICVTFWAIVYDPDLYGGSRFIKTFCHHAVTGFVIWVELFVVPHAYGKWLPELLLVWAWSALYLVWNFVCYAVNDQYVYDFQKDFTGVMGLAYIPIFLLAAAFYFIGRVIARFYWDEFNEKHNGCCCLRLPRVSPDHLLPL